MKEDLYNLHFNRIACSLLGKEEKGRQFRAIYFYYVLIPFEISGIKEIIFVNTHSGFNISAKIQIGAIKARSCPATL